MLSWLSSYITRPDLPVPVGFTTLNKFPAGGEIWPLAPPWRHPNSLHLHPAGPPPRPSLILKVPLPLLAPSQLLRLMIVGLLGPPQRLRPPSIALPGGTNQGLELFSSGVAWVLYYLNIVLVNDASEKTSIVDLLSVTVYLHVRVSCICAIGMGPEACSQHLVHPTF